MTAPVPGTGARLATGDRGASIVSGLVDAGEFCAVRHDL